MKTIMKTIAIAVIAMAMCAASTYAEWFGIGGDNHILDDDDLPDIYKFHDYEGTAIQPDMNKGNLGNVKPNIDTKNNSYKGINVKPGPQSRRL